jgi:P27 family predicted phage terminase small subunit
VNAPDSLGEAGRAKWDEVVPLLGRRDPITLTNLEVYCAAYDRWLAAQRWLDEHGDVLEIVSDKGVVVKVQPAPKLDVAARAEKAMADAMKSLRLRLT